MYGNILGVAQELFGLRETLRSARKEDRLALASYLDSIAACIDQISTTAKAPDGSNRRYEYKRPCQELQDYGQHCRPIFEAVLGPDVGEGLAERIERATYTRSGLAAGFVIGHDDVDARVAKLEEAVGVLRATAATLRAPLPRSRTLNDRLKALIGIR